MSGGTPVGGGFMRQRHNQWFASSGEDLEDDAASASPLPATPPVPRPRSWVQIMGDILWIASAAFIVYMGDTNSNFFSLLCWDNRIRRVPLYLGIMGAILNIGLVSYTVLWTWYMRKVDDKWEALSLSLAPAMALLGLLSFCSFSVALWPVWNFLTLPLLFTLFMASMIVALHLPMGALRADDDNMFRTD